MSQCIRLVWSFFLIDENILIHALRICCCFPETTLNRITLTSHTRKCYYMYMYINACNGLDQDLICNRCFSLILTKCCFIYSDTYGVGQLVN